MKLTFKQGKEEIITHIEVEDELTEEAKMVGISTTGWYFIDETQSYYCGPYDTEQKAIDGANRYAREVLGL